MSDRIPQEARDAIRAELEADAVEYRDEVPEGEWVRRNRGPSPILTLRVPVTVLEALQALAAEEGVQVSALARSFIAEGLANHQSEDLRGGA